MAFLPRSVRNVFTRDDSEFRRVSRAILLDFKTKLDPLRVGDFKSPVHNKLAVSFSDIDVIGLSKVHVIKTHFDHAHMKVIITVAGSNVKATAKYSPEPDGEALSETADCWMEAEYVTATIAMRMHSLDLDNFEHIKVDDIKFEMRYTNTHFDDLKGDKQFNEYFRFFSHQLVLVLEVQVPFILQKELEKFVHDELKKVDSNARTKEARVASLPHESPFHRALHRPTYDEHAMMIKKTDAPASDKGNLGPLFDFFIPNINALIAKEGYDPWKIDAHPKASFNYWVITGGVEAKDINIHGLSHLKRTGPIDIDELTVTLNIGVDGDVTGGCVAEAWLGFFSVGADATFVISNINIRVVITLEKDKAGKTKFALNKLDLPTDPDITVAVHGLGPLESVADLLIDALQSIVLTFFKSEFLSFLKKIIAKNLKKLDLPI